MQTFSASVLNDDMFFIGTLSNGSLCEFNLTMKKQFLVNPFNQRLDPVIDEEMGNENVTSETGYTKR